MRERKSKGWRKGMIREATAVKVAEQRVNNKGEQ